ncbi:hypothetical protein CDL15_Pgr022138 [Punica granatum]|uniref:Uncharacterized protein n=1 Tax=Punica granatum TaxID=22663 RepID=A0A218VSS9_PUNGR|nr:hypothetical protein CDL15_Pgr022138 [Punica granatum]
MDEPQLIKEDVMFVHVNVAESASITSQGSSELSKSGIVGQDQSTVPLTISSSPDDTSPDKVLLVVDEQDNTKKDDSNANATDEEGEVREVLEFLVSQRTVRAASQGVFVTVQQVKGKKMRNIGRKIKARNLLLLYDSLNLEC